MERLGLNLNLLGFGQGAVPYPRWLITCSPCFSVEARRHLQCATNIIRTTTHVEKKNQLEQSFFALPGCIRRRIFPIKKKSKPIRFFFTSSPTLVNLMAIGGSTTPSVRLGFVLHDPREESSDRPAPRAGNCFFDILALATGWQLTHTGIVFPCACSKAGKPHSANEEEQPLQNL